MSSPRQVKEALNALVKKLAQLYGPAHKHDFQPELDHLEDQVHLLLDDQAAQGKAAKPRELPAKPVG